MSERVAGPTPPRPPWTSWSARQSEYSRFLSALKASRAGPAYDYKEAKRRLDTRFPYERMNNHWGTKR